MYHNKALSCPFYSSYNSHKQSQVQYLKYLVVDSENEDEQIMKREKDVSSSPHHHPQKPPTIMTNTPPFLSNKNSRIIQHKSAALSNITISQNAIYYQDNSTNIDQQIMKAQKQVNTLQKECILLEKLIEDMNKQQAQIKIQMRIQERSRLLQQQIIIEKKNSCPIHCINHSICHASIQENKPTLNIVYSQNNTKQKQPFTVIQQLQSSMLLSRQSQSKKPSSLSHKEINISSIRSSHIKAYKNTENIVPVKKAQQKRQPWSFNFKQMKKGTRSKSKLGSISKIKKPL